jgi:hypothetical protein
VVPSSAASSIMAFRKARRATGSKPAVGSSSINTSGRMDKARTRATLTFMPRIGCGLFCGLEF